MTFKKLFYILITICFLLVLSLLSFNIFYLFFVADIAYILSICVISIVGGIGLGYYWWEIVYIKKERFRNNKK